MDDQRMEEGFEVGLEMSGNPSAFRDMLRTMLQGGKVALLGIPPSDAGIDWNEVIFKGLIIKGICGRDVFETWYKMASRLQSGLDVRPITTHHYLIAEFQQGFDVMNSGKSGKANLAWVG